MSRRPRRCAAGLVAALVVLSAAAFGCTESAAPGLDRPAGNGQPPPATEPSGAPVLPAPPDPERAIDRADLPRYPKDEVTPFRLRVHLDVIINDQAVKVPTGLGIVKNPETGEEEFFTPLHTRDDSGVVQIKSTDARTYRLAQLFQEWGQPLDKHCVAHQCADADHQLLAFANGELVPDPTSLTLTDCLQIVIWFGPTGMNPPIPKSYDWAAITPPGIPPCGAFTTTTVTTAAK